MKFDKLYTRLMETRLRSAGAEIKQAAEAVKIVMHAIQVAGIGPFTIKGGGGTEDGPTVTDETDSSTELNSQDPINPLTTVTKRQAFKDAIEEYLRDGTGKDKTLNIIDPGGKDRITAKWKENPTFAKAAIKCFDELDVWAPAPTKAR